MVAEDVGVGRPAKRDVEVAQGEQGPAQHSVDYSAEGTPGAPEFGILDDEYEEGGGWAGAPPFGDDFKAAGEEAKAWGCEAAIVVGIGVEGVAEGDDEMGVASGGEDAFDLGDDAVRIWRVFEDGVAFDAGEAGVGEGKEFGVAGDIDAGHDGEVNVDVAEGVGAG